MMVEYRVSISKKPTIRLYRVEGKFRKQLGEVSGWKAKLLKNTLLKELPLKEKIRYRDGRLITEADEDTMIRIFVGIRSIINLRKEERASKILKDIKLMDKGEVYWWHSLYLKVGYKAIQALRLAYLGKT